MQIIITNFQRVVYHVIIDLKIKPTGYSVFYLTIYALLLCHHLFCSSIM